MVIGIGIDLVQIDRFERAVARYGARLLDRLFTPSERAHIRRYRSPGRHLAVRFAAKEAAFKALRTGWGRGRLAGCRGRRGWKRTIRSGPFGPRKRRSGWSWDHADAGHADA
ncbi:MAG: holo-ACP synthase [Candidatus Methylomirabilis sp.]|nr:holo-ACP synthase [Candidatus Methylomirabilis sp.]